MVARLINRALVYLRRSTSRQEMGIKNQLEWAIAEAKRHNVFLDATLEDLEYMELHGLNQYKAIFLDDGISGSDLLRPAFQLVRETGLEDRSVSHIFIHKADRFARPEQAFDAIKLETELVLSGITIVFNNRISEPRDRGQRYFPQDMQMLFEYSQSGQFLSDLAERVLAAKSRLAKSGFWGGGRPVYGFGRVLVDQSGKEIMELADGETVRREGCHVWLKPKEKDKIAVWLMLLDWYSKAKWGLKRIARKLNELGIPSPGAGRTRKVDGVQCYFSGKWDHGAVKRLIKNAAIIGEFAYGAKSAGAHRRYSSDGPRLLRDSDRSAADRPIRVANDAADVIRGNAAYDPLISRQQFEACNATLVQRGKNQRGLQHTDPADLPLSGRIFDLTEGCGALMYAAKPNGRRIYLCSRYSESGGKECRRHHVDAEASLKFILAVLRQRVQQLGGRSEIRKRLTAIAARHQSRPADASKHKVEQCKQTVARLSGELTTIKANLALAKKPQIFAVVSEQFELKQQELAAAERTLVEQARRLKEIPEIRSPEDDVASGMALFDKLNQLTEREESRENVAEVLRKLCLVMGIRFTDNPSNKRPRFVPMGGVISIGTDGDRVSRMHCCGHLPPDAGGAKGKELFAFGSNGLPAAKSDSCRQEKRNVGKGALDDSAHPTGLPLPTTGLKSPR